MKTTRKREWNAVLCAFGLLTAAGAHAQFFQIENQLNAALDLQLAASLPLIK